MRLAVRRNTASKSGPEEDDTREEIAARVGLAEPRDRRLHYFVRCPGSISTQWSTDGQPTTTWALKWQA